jgi:hypothetical protein
VVLPDWRGPFTITTRSQLAISSSEWAADLGISSPISPSCLDDPAASLSTKPIVLL